MTDAPKEKVVIDGKIIRDKSDDEFIKLNRINFNNAD